MGNANGVWQTIAAIVFLNLTGTSLPAQPCAPQLNKVACENTRPGNPPQEWDIAGSPDPSIQGFATDISVNIGETVRFKVDTDASQYQIRIYRLGYYQGMGARLVTTISPSATLPQVQPEPLFDPASGLVDCGNWTESASWSVPTNAVSGVYLGKLVRSDSGGASHIYFVVRDDAGQSDLLFQTSDTTWQAYNGYGGRNLYDFFGTTSPRAYKVSYNRPFTTRTDIEWHSLFTAEYPMIRWLEANGYDVSYTTGVDTARRGELLLTHKAFLSVGHDEYWSAGQRANVETARNAGIHLAFFSGNEIFWKTRWEASIDGSATPYRTLVCYKETKANAKIDPHVEWTGTWRDPRFSPPSDGGAPESALSGTLFAVNGISLNSIEVPAHYGGHRFWRNTTVATLPPGDKALFAPGTLGFEWDEAPTDQFRPPGLMYLSHATVSGVPVLQDYGNSYASGTATHNLCLYRHASGALVFGAGTIQWSWGLENEHDNSSGVLTADPRIQQATVNLFADMGVHPQTLQTGLLPALQSSDHVPPTCSITWPTNGGVFEPGVLITMVGTAADNGGKVWGVEVSTDGGISWRPAVGRETWSFSWTPATPGTLELRARAVDDSGNLGSPTNEIAVLVEGGQLTIWSDSEQPAQVDGGPENSLELGVKFRSDVAGTVSGIRFYKSAANKGPHVGNLWTATGELLASVSFAGGSESGWQQMNFATPIQIQPNTVFVASYHCPKGHYSVNLNYFSGMHSTPPLHALPDGLTGGNGVFTYSPTSIFPSNTFREANYWVDVAFKTPLAIHGTAVPSGTLYDPYQASLTAIGGKKPYAWTITEGSLPPGLALDASTGTISGIPSSHGTYVFTAQVADASNPTQSASRALSITIYAGPPLTLWPASATPAVADGGEDNPVELGVKFRSDVAGTITGIRFYKSSANSGLHVGNLWSSQGALLASAVFTGESASGWQQVSFASPVQIAANTVYVASYHCPRGHYSIDRNFFSGSLQNPPLHALADTPNGGNGVFAYGSTSKFPTNSYSAANYWVDVNFQTPLAITTTYLPYGIAQQPFVTSLEARSGRAPYTWTVSAGSLPPGLTLEPSTGTISGTPTTRGTYGFTVEVLDESNPEQRADKEFSITVYAGPPLTIFDGNTTPATIDGGADSPVQLGVKFRSDVNGAITGVRFYKSSANLGPHVGTLWTLEGTLLASATFVGETASGWQQVNFANPIPISAGVAYVAAYHCPNGHYSIDLNGLASGVNNPPLRAVADELSSGNGVFVYGASTEFPIHTFGAANYWVDVAFQTPLVITTTSVPNGSTQTAYSAALKATSGRTPYVWTIIEGSLPPGLALDASTGTISGIPSSHGTYVFTAQVADASNPTQSASRALSITIYAGPPLTLWPASATPAVADGGEDNPVELGVKFRSDVAGTITGIRFYKSSANSGLHVGNLWSSQGALLASAVFTGESASGWQQVSFASPVQIAANTVYVASYHCPQGHYSIDRNYFEAFGVDNAPLHAPATEIAGGNGVFIYGPGGEFPAFTGGAANYWVDVLFIPNQ